MESQLVGFLEKIWKILFSPVCETVEVLLEAGRGVWGRGRDIRVDMAGGIDNVWKDALYIGYISNLN